MSTDEIERRAEQAKDLFRQGFNCSQSVFAACADIYGIHDRELALRLAASFGGGIGRMRQTCGAACGMFLLEGLHSGSDTPHDAAGKGANYARVQALAQSFRQTNGSLICSELLGISPTDSSDNNPLFHSTPSPRTDAYYQKRPCTEMVASAVRIFLTSLSEE